MSKNYVFSLHKRESDSTTHNFNRFPNQISEFYFDEFKNLENLSSTAVYKPLETNNYVIVNVRLRIN